jgi:hypothetical protein
VLADPEVEKYFRENRVELENLEFEMKWSKRSIPIYRIEVQ